MLHIAHIVNPFKPKPNSDLNLAQELTFASMIHARNNANSNLKIDFYSAQFAEDRLVIPKEFSLTNDLHRSVLDYRTFKTPIKLPFIGDILERLYYSSTAEYLIYSNIDIGLFPNFYNQVETFINEGHDAFIINRRRLSNKFNSLEQLPFIYKEKGKSHPGFDCFVFHRDLFPSFKLGLICIGVPFIEIAFSQNLFALSKNFKLYDQEILTFHIGEEIFKKRAPREYYRFNRKQFHLIEKEIKPLMKIESFPYANLSFVHRLIVWALHPCIPIRIVIQLELKRLFKKTSLLLS